MDTEISPASFTMKRRVKRVWQVNSRVAVDVALEEAQKDIYVDGKGKVEREKWQIQKLEEKKSGPMPLPGHETQTIMEGLMWDRTVVIILF